jgi:photosystem II stability/assembly factor-like uncharacterized protein
VGCNDSADGIIYKTTSGGINWQNQLGDTVAKLSSVYFVDENVGWVVGVDGIILKTTNGGEEWEDISFDTQVHYQNVQFIDENIGYLSGSYKLAKTSNGGETWENILDTLYGSSASFIDSNTGWLLDTPWLFKTINGGGNWMFLSELHSCLPSIIFFINDSIGWNAGNHSCLGQSGFIKKTTNGGIDWVTQIDFWGNYSNSIHSIFFIDENYGWAGGIDAIDTLLSAIILNTTNGGENWITQLVGEPSTYTYPPTFIASIFFVDENYGWAVGSNGIILHTTNGGVSFVEEDMIYDIPNDYYLNQNYPNPFNPITTIKYSVPQTSKVVIKVFDILRNEIETLINEEKPVGTYEITWLAESLPSGVYFYQLKAGDFVEIKKMVLLK